jgi:hypothetical protein
MIIIASSHLPDEAAQVLRKLGRLLLLPPQQGVYESIATHPDIYFCHDGECLYVSPLISKSMLSQLGKIRIEIGERAPGPVYPATALYNAVLSPTLLIHNLKVTDNTLLKASENRSKIHVSQAYTRCNLINLDDEHFITSDKGIEKALLKHSKKVCFINPSGVRLKGHKHGFFGGACGISGRTLFICGSLSRLDESELLSDFLSNAGWHLISLYNGPLLDLGSLLIIEQNSS